MPLSLNPETLQVGQLPASAPSSEPADAAATSASASSTFSEPTERTSADVLGQWAACSPRGARELRAHLADYLTRQPPVSLLQTLHARPAMSRPSTLAAIRMLGAGLPRLLDDWIRAAEADGSRRDAAWARRVCKLLDRVMGDDRLSALAQAHGLHDPSAPLQNRLQTMERLLDMAMTMPDPVLPPSRTLLPWNPPLRTPEEMPSPTTSSRIWGELVEAAFIRPVDPIDQGLPALDFSAARRWGEAQLECEAPDPVTPMGASLLRRRRVDGLPLLRIGTAPNLLHQPSLDSGEWLPSLNFESWTARTGEPGSGGDDSPGVEGHGRQAQALDLAASTPAHQALFLRAVECARRLRRTDRQMSDEEMAQLDQAKRLFDRMRYVMVKPARGTTCQRVARPDASREAFAHLAAWVRQSDGVEGVRRECWFDLLAQRTFDPTVPVRVPAELFEAGAELPPTALLHELLPPESVLDHATMIWRGQALNGTRGLAGLLDRLGVRHLDLSAPQLARGSPPAPLQGVDITVVSLHGIDLVPTSDIALQIDALTRALPSLYRLRVSGSLGPIDARALPEPWRVHPVNRGWWVHERRNANRERLQPLRELWPDGRLPPALRAGACNVGPDGERVLDYIVDVRKQLADAVDAGSAEIALCAYLGTIVDGLWRDETFARRCREMAEHPPGPCADAGMLALSAMSALRDATEARNPAEVAENVFLQACLARANSNRVQRRPKFDEVLEEAMVLRWHLSRVVDALLGNGRIRLADAPLFGGSVEGEDWNSPRRRSRFEGEAFALVATECLADFPGVRLLLSVQDEPLGAMFQARLDREPDCAALAMRRRAVVDAQTGDETAAALSETAERLAAIDTEWQAARMALVRPRLAEIGAKVRRVLERAAAAAKAAKRSAQAAVDRNGGSHGNDGNQGPSVKRPRQ